MTPAELEEKYAVELEALRGLTESTSMVNTALVLRNVFAILLTPALQNPELFEVLTNLITIDLKHVGYMLVKDPEFVPPESPESPESSEA